MIELKIEVDGMKCGMCESHVNNVVRNICGVKKVSSSHKKNQVIVVADDNVDKDSVINAIKTQGYNVGSIETYSYVKRGFFRKK